MAVIRVLFLEIAHTLLRPAGRLYAEQFFGAPTFETFACIAVPLCRVPLPGGNVPRAERPINWT